MEVKIINDIVELYSIPFETGITLMGAGKLAKQLLQRYPAISTLIKKIAISECPYDGYKVEGMPLEVGSIAEPTISRERWVVIAATEGNIVAMLSVLATNKYQKVILLSKKFCKSFLYEPESGFYSSHSRTMLRYEVQVAEHCNLNCAGCYHFSPLAQEEFLDVDGYRRDTRRLSELFNSEVEWVHLMGGEPLLNPRLPEIMEITRKAFRYGRIMIVTNGLLLPKMQEFFWKQCHEYEIEVCPTKYPIHFDYDAVKETAEKFQVQYHYYNDGQTVKTLERFPLSPSRKEAPEINFAHCIGANNCITLRDGKLYTCVFPAHAHHLIAYFDLDIHVSPRDGVDIYSVKNAEELMDRLARPIPFCQYCKVNDVQYGLPFTISKRKKSEWLDEQDCEVANVSNVRVNK